jgi:ATP-binding cassette subfamily G (WHITE) protein 2 (SNQ2)
MATILAAPMANSLQIPFLEMRNIYEIREGPTKFYGWTALITSALISELPWNILASSMFFLCWYESNCSASLSLLKTHMQVLDCRF